MNKIILISLLATSAIFADMMTDMAKDMAISQAKTQVKDTAIKEVAGNDVAKQKMAKSVADRISPEPSPADKLKNDMLGKVMGGTNTSTSGMLGKTISGTTNTSASGMLGNVLSNTTKKPTMKDTATDMAVEKVVGSDPIKKAVAKEAVKSLGI